MKHKYKIIIKGNDVFHKVITTDQCESFEEAYVYAVHCNNIMHTLTIETTRIVGIWEIAQ